MQPVTIDRKPYERRIDLPGTQRALLVARLGGDEFEGCIG